MSHRLNEQLAQQLEMLQPQFSQVPEALAGDLMSLRKKFQAFYQVVNQVLPEVADVMTRDYQIPQADGGSLLARWYQSSEATSDAAVLFIHGGGGMAASIADYHKLLTSYVAHTGVNFLALEYGLSPELPGAAQAKQAFTALQWLQTHSQRLAIDQDRIAIMGDSGGGGIAASAAILARDHGLPLARQILICPMLDDRTSNAPTAIEPFLTVTAQDVRDAWQARKSRSLGNPSTAYLSPAHLIDYHRLAPTYIDVGDLDLFRDESLDYARRLIAANVPVEFHLYSGANHGFELIAPHSTLALQAMESRYRAITDI